MACIGRSLAPALFLLAAASAGARAAEFTTADYPTQEINRGFQTPAGMTQITGDVGASLSSGNVFQPISPSIGVSHGFFPGFSVEADFGLCLNGPGTGCASAADNASLGATYSIGSLGPIATAFTAGLNITAFSPNTELMLPVGALFRFTPVKDTFSLVLAPQLAIGLTDRNTGTFDQLRLPLSLQYQAMANLALNVNAGIGILLSPPTGVPGTVVPVGVSALYAIGHTIDITGSFQFDNLLGSNGGADRRSLAIGFNFRL